MWATLLFLTLSAGLCGPVNADSTMERKFKFEEDENPNYQEILKTLKGTQSNVEQLQDTVQALVNIVAEMVAEKEAETASKERDPLRVDLGFLGESVKCFSVCLEYFFKGLMKLVTSILTQLASSWAQWDIVMKCIAILTVFHALSSIKDAVLNGMRLTKRGYKAIKFAIGMVLGIVSWTRRIKVEDDIEAYEQLSGRRKYRDETQVEFIERLVNEWKTMTSRLSDSRILRILGKHFPREFLNTIYDLDLDTVSADVVMRKWSNYVRIHRLRETTRAPILQGQGIVSRQPIPRRANVQTRGNGKCVRCNGDHLVKDCRWPADIQCNFCKKSGHIKAACGRLRNRVNAVENPLFDQESVVFDEASIVDDPCLDNSQRCIDYNLPVSPGEPETSSRSVSEVKHLSIRATLPTSNTFATLQMQKIGNAKCLLDTGAAVSVIGAGLLRRRRVSGIDRTKKTLLRGFNNKSQPTEGTILLGIRHGKKVCRVPFHVIDVEIDTILGYNALNKMQTVWDLGAETATMGGSPIPLSSRNSNGQ